LLEGVDFKKIKVKGVTQKKVMWCAVGRLGSGKVVCGGGGEGKVCDETIHLFGSQFNKILSKPLSGYLISLLLVGNYIYCGIDDGYVVVFNENLN
jgi:hypothetical protein